MNSKINREQFMHSLQLIHNPLDFSLFTQNHKSVGFIHVHLTLLIKNPMD